MEKIINQIKINNIGLDIDGVIFSKAKYQLEKGMLYFSKTFHQSPDQVIKNIEGYDVKEIFECGEIQRFLFWAIYVWEYCLFTTPQIGVKNITEKWLKEQRNIYLISGRKETEEGIFISLMLVLLTKFSIYKNKINHNGLFFCADSRGVEGKLKLCEQLKINLMIDDRPDILIGIAKQCYTLCMKDIWNVKMETNSPKITNLYEADNYIIKLERVRND